MPIIIKLFQHYIKSPILPNITHQIGSTVAEDIVVITLCAKLNITRNMNTWNIRTVDTFNYDLRRTQINAISSDLQENCREALIKIISYLVAF